MYKELIGSLTYLYSIVAKGRDKLNAEQMNGLKDSGRLITKCAGKIAEDESRQDKIDYQEAIKINNHIEEMVIFQLANGEIC